MAKRATRSKSRRRNRQRVSRKRSFSKPRRTPKTNRSRSLSRSPNDFFSQLATKLFQKKISAVFAQRAGFDAEFVEKKVNQLFESWDKLSGIITKATSKLPKEVLYGLFALLVAFGVMITFFEEKLPTSVKVLKERVKAYFTKPPEPEQPELPKLPELPNTPLPLKGHKDCKEGDAKYKVAGKCVTEENYQKAVHEALQKQQEVPNVSKEQEVPNVSKEQELKPRKRSLLNKLTFGILGKSEQKRLRQRDALRLYQARRAR